MVAKLRVALRLLIVAPAVVVLGCGETPPPPAPVTPPPAPAGKDPGPPTALQKPK